jgi:hypothetical protein
MKKLPRVSIEQRTGSLLGVLSQLHNPSVLGERRREVQNDIAHSAVGGDTFGFQRSVDCRTRVDDDQVAGIEKIRKIEETSMRHRVIVETRHHQAHLIARKPTNLRRLVCSELVGDLKVQSRFNRDHAARDSGVSSAEAT